MTIVTGRPWGQQQAEGQGGGDSSRIDSSTMSQSLFSNTLQLVGAATDQSIVRINTPPQNARAWRVTLERVDRADRHAPLVVGDASGSASVVVGQIYPYAGGFQTAPFWPPVRSNPVLGTSVQPGTPRISVQLAWGMGGANPARLAADWPMMGGSIVVVGSYVEVFAALAGTSVSLQALPVVTAHVVPADGLPTCDGGELSLNQEINVRAFTPAVVGPPFVCATWGGVAYVPDFARRVKVILTTADVDMCGETHSAPFDGDPTCVLTWFDDQSNAIDSSLQGLFRPPGAAADLYTPPVWHAVPARATLLAVRGGKAFNQPAQLHWRIAP